MRIKSGTTRRKLLEGTGSMILLAPLMRFFRETEAYGADIDKPNVIFFYWATGSYKDSFYPTGTASSLDSFPIVTKPLADHKANMVFFKGLSARGGSNHTPAPKNTLAGWTQGYDGQNALPYSLDQMLADRLGQGSSSRLVNVGVVTSVESANTQAISYDKNGAVVTNQDNPKLAYDAVFKGFKTNSLGLNGLALAESKIVDGKKRVLDFVREDLKTVKRTLGPIESQIYEAHVNSLDTLYTDIVRREKIAMENGGGGTPTGVTPMPGTGGGGGTAASRCSPDPIKGLADMGSGDAWYHKVENTAKVCEFNRRLVVEAMACGLTKVGTLQYGWSECFREFLVGDAPVKGMGYHSYSHNGDNNPYYYLQSQIMKEAATMMADMKTIKVGSKSLFDNTLIMGTTCIGDNVTDHDGVGITAWLAGLTDKLKGNRLINYPYERGILSSGQDYNKLLTTVAHLMGQTDINSIGNSKIVGKLTEV